MNNQRKMVPAPDISPEQPAGSGAMHQQIAGQLAGAVAHDLNNMLATILGCLELMERRIEEPDRLIALIKRSSDAVERAASLTSRLAQFARRQQQPKASLEINAFIADLMPLIVSALGRRIRVSVEASLVPAYVHVDPTGLEAVLLAFCLATRAAMLEAGVVGFATQVSGAEPAISFSATGPGLDQLDLSQSYCIAAAAGLTVRTGQSADKTEVTIVVSAAAT